MLPYISRVTEENANQYELDLYYKTAFPDQRIEEIIILHNDIILCKLYLDDNTTFMKAYDERIDVHLFDYNIDTNKKIRGMCRVIGQAIGTATSE